VSVPILVRAAGTALTALVVTDVLSEVLRRIALRRGITDRPDVRKAHRRPVPYLGGVAIAAGTLVPAAILIPHRGHTASMIIMAGAAVVALVGLVDDCRSLHPVTRLLVEAFAATSVVFAGHVHFLGSRLDPVLAVVWIVLLTNSFNLLDNMDGAAATIAFVSASFLAAAAYLAGETGIALLLLALTAGCLGFLIHNWAPARMFMGDAGSLFIGFVISASAVWINVPCRPSARMAELLLLTFVATVDTCLVLISRRRAGRSFLAAGTDHASHRLRRLGLSTQRVTMALCAATALSCSCGLLMVSRCLSVSGAGALAGTVAAASALVWLLLKVPGYPRPDDPAPANGAISAVPE
jgi:UDP-GlcNAc:undecaprenyl-phosphate/decaprenyl-phosphate GlcNAc-1-phosphate transferase